MFSLLQLAVLIVAIQGAYSVKCYVMVPNENAVIGVYMVDAGNNPELPCNATTVCTCASFRKECASGDSYCSAAEIQTKVTKWVYALFDKNLCASVAQTPLFMNVTCCTTDLCNNQALNTSLVMTTPQMMTTTKKTGGTPSMMIHSFPMWIALLILYIALK